LSISGTNEIQKNLWLDSIIASKKVEQNEDENEGLVMEEWECDNDDEVPRAECCEVFADDDYCDYECEQEEMKVQSRSMAMPMKSIKMSQAPGGGAMGKRGGMMQMDGMIMAEKKRVVVEKYVKAGAAFEYGERHQFFDGNNSLGAINQFWLSIMKNIVDGKGN
jgi:hypothetical protein